MQVFDRWGSLVFNKEQYSPNDETVGWDGTFQGQALAQGVYVYWLEIELMDGRKVILKGDVVLMD